MVDASGELPATEVPFVWKTSSVAGNLGNVKLPGDKITYHS